MKKAVSIPRPEHPKPQFRRADADWRNLNGTWDFLIDHGASAFERGAQKPGSKLFDRTIVVPFCPESKLSGVRNVDFMRDVWYRREVSFPEEWAGKRILLRFGGVDFRSQVWLDGANAGQHNGGSAPWALDVTDLAKPGEKQTLVLHAHDETRGFKQGLGKQSNDFFSRGCSYTRTTGVWQTVWAEAVHPQGLAACRTTPNLDTSEVVLEPRFLSVKAGDRFRAVVRAGRTVVAERDVPAAQGLPLSLAIPEVREWSPSDPFLYDLTLTVERGGEVLDRVESYFAMRKISCEGDRILLNGKPIFLRFVLDQGFYPDGIWTAPTDRELKADIERSMAMGFNGARLHQKVFEDRFHYWADRLGYLTWAEYPSWPLDVKDPEAQRNYFEDWTQTVRALRDHPSIVGWSPFNESNCNQIWNETCSDRATPDGPVVVAYRDFMRNVVALTREADPTRPVNDTSGYIHVETDLWTVHSYRGSAKEQRAWLLPKGGKWPVAANHPVTEEGYAGQPFLVDEWGGFKYQLPADRGDASGWGYNGLNLTDEKEFLRLVGEQTALFARLKELSGWCYTQLTDIEQEQNGVYTYDRRPKADPAKLAALFGAKPKWSAW